MATARPFDGSFFDTVFFDADVVIETWTGSPNWLKTKSPKVRKKRKVIKWSDYAHAEDRIEALSKALAETSVPLETAPSEFDEDDALIEALVLTKILQ